MAACDNGCDDVVNPDIQDELWKKIEKSMRKMRKRSVILLRQFEDVQLSMYRFCTNRPYSSSLSRNLFPCNGELHNNVFNLLSRTKAFVRAETKKIVRKIERYSIDEDFLRAFVREWRRFNDFCNFLYDAFQSIGYGKQGYDLALRKWGVTVFKALMQRIDQSLYVLVKEEGEVVGNPEKLIRRLMFIEIASHNLVLGFHHSFGPVCNMRAFFTTFLGGAETILNYKKDEAIKSATLLEYLERLNAIFDDEYSWLTFVLNVHCMKTIDQWKIIFDRVFNPENLEQFHDEFKDLVLQENVEKLHRVHFMLRHCFAKTEKFETIFENYIHSKIEEEFSKCKNDIRNFIKSVNGSYRKYKDFTWCTFHYDSHFNLALERAFSKSINTRKLFLEQGENNATLFGKYCIELLKTDSSCYVVSLNDLVRDLDEVLFICKYLLDKDQFNTTVITQLVVEQIPDSKVRQLREVCHFQNLEELLKLVDEIMKSAEIQNEFRKQLIENKSEKAKIYFDVKVIPKDCLIKAEKFTLLLPPEFQELISEYSDFYATFYRNKRKLNWQFGLSIGEIDFTFSGKTYTIRATTYQIAILLQFNKKTKWSFKDIEKNTEIEESHLVAVLESIFDAKLLCCEVRGSNLSENNAIVEICTDLKIDDKEIDLTALQKDVMIDKRNSEFNNDERISVVEVAIVRILKKVKKLSRSGLIETVRKELLSRFEPTISEIRQSTKKLIEKDYIRKRDCKKGSVYCYLP